MTDIFLRRTLSGFAPDTDDDQEAVKRFRLNEVVRADVVKPRNIRFHRKWFALVKVGYQLWEEFCPRHQYNGTEVLPEFERFRKDVTILAGYAKPVINVKGELRLEAESISFASMDDERFEKLYSATINVLLNKILAGRGITEDRLRAMAEAVLEFA